MPSRDDTGGFDEIMLTDPLTEREVEIVSLLAEGLSDREIGRDLSLALETVKWYNKRIYSKLGAGNRTQAVARARSLGLLDNGEAGGPAPLDAPALPRHNLPAPVTSFVGRQREIGEARRLLAGARLLSIAGPAGCGKTRLAQQLASQVLPHFPDGAYFVPLAPVAAEHLLWAMAERMAIQFHTGDEPLRQLLDYLQEKTLLLVLDNFEHLLAGAGLIAEILRAAPAVKVLVTSRERLNLYGEVIYRLDGLALPGRNGPEEVLGTEAADLFVQRAQAVNPNWKPDREDAGQIARICRLVEGMPLAIELAATWIVVLSPGQIAGEIEQSLDILTTEWRDVPASQKSMRAAIARSWRLLNEEEQAAFRRLSIFRGGFTRDAVQTVAGVGVRTLQALAGKSLLQYDQGAERYQVHELLRHYAREQLEAAGEAAQMQEAHAVYFADFMAACWPQMKGRRQFPTLLAVEADLENARAAWRYWIRQEDGSQLKKFLHTFWVIHDIRGWYPAGLDLFAEGAAVMRSQAGSEAEAGLGWLLAAQGLYRVSGEVSSPDGFALAREGVQILKRLQRGDELIVPLVSLFITAFQVSEGEVAAQAAQDCLAIATAVGDQWGIAKAKQLQAILAIKNSEYEQAEQLGQEALALFDQIGDNWSTSVIYIEILGRVAVTLHRFDAAKAWIERGLEAAYDTDFQYSLQMAHWQLGYIEALQENYAAAGRYWHKARQMGERVVGTECFIGFGGLSILPAWTGRKLIDEPKSAITAKEG